VLKQGNFTADINNTVSVHYEFYRIEKAELETLEDQFDMLGNSRDEIIETSFIQNRLNKRALTCQLVNFKDAAVCPFKSE